METHVNDLFRLSGRIAFVTGAAGHLGSAIATALAEAGATVYLNGRTAAKLEALRESLTAQGYAAEAAAFDITDEEAVRSFFSDLANRHGSLDVLVNNAYSGRTAPPTKFDRVDYIESYTVSVVSAAQALHHATPLLKEAARQSESASVINVASMYGRVSPDPEIYGDSGYNNPAFYGAAKAALIQFTRYAACHLAKDRIRVNAISPGPFPPPATRIEQPAFYDRLCRKVPLGRVGQASELKGAALFLASNASSFVTGADLPVDGGWTAW